MLKKLQIINNKHELLERRNPSYNKKKENFIDEGSGRPDGENEMRIIDIRKKLKNKVGRS